jgi:RNA polymerase sigma factor (sigma-70 family)
VRVTHHEDAVEPLSYSIPAELESTATLLARVRDGDRLAREDLVRRYLATLLRWGHGRLPSHARDLSDTQDLVQVTLLKALDHVGSFEPRREGAFLAYLRTILLNEVRGEIRRVARRPGREALSDELSEPEPSPVEKAIGAAALRAYERALDTLSAEEREGVILRIEMGYTHQQVAEALGKPSADAARMLVARAMVRLTEAMDV